MLHWCSFSQREFTGLDVERMPLGLFEGERTDRLEEVAGGTEFSMTELLSGPLSGLITRTIPDITDSFNQFADSLKIAAEATHVIPPAHREPAHCGPGPEVAAHRSSDPQR
jgi:hypothetical protein